jgi:hypothetical protein
VGIAGADKSGESQNTGPINLQLTETENDIESQAMDPKIPGGESR